MKSDSGEVQQSNPPPLLSFSGALRAGHVSARRDHRRVPQLQRGRPGRHQGRQARHEERGRGKQSL